MNDFLRKVVRKSDLHKYTGLRRTAIADAEQNDPNFPKSFPITEGGRARGYWEDDIIRWQRGRDAARDRENPEAKPAQGKPGQSLDKSHDK